MSNRRHLTQAQDKQRRAAMEAHPSHEHHQASLDLVAHGQSVASKGRSSQSAMLAAQANTMRLKKGNAARHG